MRRTELFPFLEELSSRGREELGALRATRVKPQEQLLQRGDRADGAYFVLLGTLRVYYVTEGGREATLYNVGPGGTCILALSSTLLDQAYPAWVEAGSEGGTVTRVRSETFHRLMAAEPAFRGFVLEAMSSRIFELMRTLEDVSTTTIVRRVATYLVRHAEGGEVAVTQARLAAELGTAREVVFRALRALAERGLIGTQRGRVRVLDPVRLARYVRSRGANEP
jgi:CRP/FNR family transcriptional regulator